MLCYKSSSWWPTFFYWAAKPILSHLSRWHYTFVQSCCPTDTCLQNETLFYGCSDSFMPQTSRHGRPIKTCLCVLFFCKKIEIVAKNLQNLNCQKKSYFPRCMLLLSLSFAKFFIDSISLSYAKSWKTAMNGAKFFCSNLNAILFSERQKRLEIHERPAIKSSRQASPCQWLQKICWLR